MSERLPVGEGHVLAWSCHGADDGIPVLLLHGGPGSGRSAGALEAFDPATHRVVAFDQRGCGKSLPHAGDDLAALSANTTAHLVADIERLRVHLGIARWLVVGGSFGATLALAYAQAHPGNVSGVVLHAVTTTSREEIAWLTGDAGRFFPEEHEAFVAHVPEAAEVGGLVEAYRRRLVDPDPAIHSPAADAWCAWDRLQGMLDPRAPPSPRWDDPRFRLGFARLVTHYWASDGFLAPGALLAGCAQLAQVPGVLIHGRLDLGSPPITAWRVHRAWPGSQLEIVEGVGHGADGMRRRVAAAVARLTAADGPGGPPASRLEDR